MNPPSSLHHQAEGEVRWVISKSWQNTYGVRGVEEALDLNLELGPGDLSIRVLFSII